MPCRCPSRLLPIAVCLSTCLRFAAGSPVKTVCSKGFYQEEVIVLGCEGGKGRQSMILSSQAAAQGQFSWEVAKDTFDLSIEVLCEPLKSLHGSAKLSAKCVEPQGEVILGESKGLLNQSAVNLKKSSDCLSRSNGPAVQPKRMVSAHGAQWSWSGDVPRKHSGPFSLWLRVQGRLHCDVEFLVQNDQDSNLAVDVRYKWSQIKPCPKQLKGCSRCPTDKCHEEDVAVCDGSPYWECLPKEAVMRKSELSTAPGEHEQTTGHMTTSTPTTMTTTTPKPLSLDDLMEDPQVQSLLREKESVNKPDLPSGPLPTSHPAVTVTDRRHFRLPSSKNLAMSMSDMRQSHHLPWAAGIVLALCILLTVAVCISRSAETSEQVRGQLGVAIQGQRTPYSPIDGDAPDR
ncbi:unnamed protein product [Cladocopium goreaui]|uniref:ATP synthase subunit b, chloroplastic n=1 Tax=Cladocopium goreaui TaxID=2562237 RepID=A0A9P1M6C8_9DINO|nr:unnamed protein product [Cladocopium goreaui]